jgi:hypothetical protein
VFAPFFLNTAFSCASALTDAVGLRFTAPRFVSCLPPRQVLRKCGLFLALATAKVAQKDAIAALLPKAMTLKVCLRRIAYLTLVLPSFANLTRASLRWPLTMRASS